MIGLIPSKVYSSIFDITKENNKFELYNFPDSKLGDISYEKVRDEIERDSELTDITAADSKRDITAPNILKKYREQTTKRMKDGKYKRILAIFVSSMFQDFESFLRTKFGMV